MLVVRIDSMIYVRFNVYKVIVQYVMFIGYIVSVQCIEFTLCILSKKKVMIIVCIYVPSTKIRGTKPYFI